MDRIETDLTADDQGVIHLPVGAPGQRVHVIVEMNHVVRPPLGQWLAAIGRASGEHPPIPLESLSRAELYGRGGD